jgi:hypothetical protein
MVRVNGLSYRPPYLTRFQTNISDIISKLLSKVRRVRAVDWSNNTLIVPIVLALTSAKPELSNKILRKIPDVLL